MNRRGRGKVGDDRGAVTFEYYPHTYPGFVYYSEERPDPPG